MQQAAVGSIAGCGAYHSSKDQRRLVGTEAAALCR